MCIFIINNHISANNRLNSLITLCYNISGIVSITVVVWCITFINLISCLVNKRKKQFAFPTNTIECRCNNLRTFDCKSIIQQAHFKTYRGGCFTRPRFKIASKSNIIAVLFHGKLYSEYLAYFPDVRKRKKREIQKHNCLNSLRCA